MYQPNKYYLKDLWVLEEIKYKKLLGMHWGHAMDSMFEILPPKVMVLEDGAFGRDWAHEGEALLSGISAL